jgi:hypothetical protein
MAQMALVRIALNRPQPSDDNEQSADLLVRVWLHSIGLVRPAVSRSSFCIAV